MDCCALWKCTIIITYSSYYYMYYCHYHHCPPHDHHYHHHHYIIILLEIWIYHSYVVFAGFFSGTTYPGFNVAFVAYFVKNFSTIRGISCSGIALGFTVFPPLAQCMIDRYGWQGSLLIMSALLGNIVVCGMLLRPDEFWKQEHPPEEPRPLQVTEIDDGRQRLKNYAPISEQSISDSLELHDKTKKEFVMLENGNVENGIHYLSLDDLKYEYAEIDQICMSSEVARVISLRLESRSSNPFVRLCRTVGFSMLTISFRLALFVFSQFMFAFCYVALTSHVVASVVYSGVDAQTASFLISFIGGGSFLGRLANGILIDFGWMSAKNVYMVSILSCGLAVMLLRLATAFWMAAMLCVVAGLASGTVMSLQVVLPNIYVGKRHMGRALGLMMFTYGIGGTIGPILGGKKYSIIIFFSFSSSFFFLEEDK